jgi:hypothetical protein
MRLNARERAVYFELLEKSTTLGVVSLFLKNLNLPYSANTWSEMREKRLEPAIAEDRVSRAQLLGLLADAEEFGHQNIFLFRCNKNTALQFVNEDTLRSGLKKLGRLDLLERPPIVATASTPEDLRLTQVRLEQTSPDSRALVVKAIEARQYWKKVHEEETATRKVKEYNRYIQRAVDVAKLHSNGLLEIRIQMYEEAADYRVALQSFWSQVNPVLPERSFEQQSLKKFKDYLLDNRATLEPKIRYAPLLARNEAGYTMALGVPTIEKSLFQDAGTSESFAAFSKHDATIESSNFIWKKQNTARPFRDIHIRIAGQVNQFSLLVSCERADYERLFQDIENHHA